MRLARVPVETRGLHGAAQHGLSVREPGQGGRIETAELMERIAFVVRAPHGRIEETDVERGIVSDQDRALAIEFAQRAADRPENLVECFLLVDGEAKRVRHVDTRYLQRLRIEQRSLERDHMRGDDRIRMHESVLVHAHDRRGDFEQRMPLTVEPARLDVDDDRQETAEAFVGDRFLTGDIGYMDDDGYFYLVDRKKDMIISGGFNVYPQMIEQAIYTHPSVHEVIVIGIPDAYRGEAAKAFITLRPDAKPFTLGELRTFLTGKIGKHELPAALEFVKELPRTPVGKLSRHELRSSQQSALTKKIA